MSTPQPVDLKRPIGELVGGKFAVSTRRNPAASELLILEVSQPAPDQVEVRHSLMSQTVARRRRVDPEDRLERVAEQLMGTLPRYAVTAPRIRWGVNNKLKYPQAAIAFTTLSLVLFALVVVTARLAHPAIMMALLIAFAASAPIATFFLRARYSYTTEVLPAWNQRRTWRGINPFLRRAPENVDELAIGSVTAPTLPGTATARVAEVKEAYGALLSDVVYRVEHPALFDPAVEETREFTLLMARWEDSAGTLSPDDAGQLARELELAFAEARAHAEAAGMGHLPTRARPTAERVVKALRVAQASNTPGERHAALERANQLLASLALYYLPDQAETTRLLGESHPQLEP